MYPLSDTDTYGTFSNMKKNCFYKIIHFFKNKMLTRKLFNKWCRVLESLLLLGTNQTRTAAECW